MSRRFETVASAAAIMAAFVATLAIAGMLVAAGTPAPAAPCERTAVLVPDGMPSPTPQPPPRAAAMSEGRRSARGRDPKYRGYHAQAAMPVWPVAERADDLGEPVDWRAWRKCPMCAAETGEPCMTMTVGGPEALPEIPMRVPHSPRKRKGGLGRG